MKASPVADTYEDVKNMIYKICHRFHDRFGGDFEELVEIANEVFMDVYQVKIDPVKGSFNTMLYTSIWRRLGDVNQYNKKKWSMVSIDSKGRSGETSDAAGEYNWGGLNGSAASIVDNSPLAFNVGELLEDVSSDAATVLKLVFDTPAELMQMAMGKGGSGKNWRSSLRAYLIGMGWAVSRIVDSFEEIQEVLQS